MWWWHDGYGMAPWGWVLMAVSTLVFWGLIIWAVVTVAHRIAPSGRRESSAREILDERFARGEIDEEEYARRRDLIESRRTGTGG